MQKTFSSLKKDYWALLVLSSVEILMGILFFPVVWLQQYNSVLLPLLQKLFFFLHLTALTCGGVLALHTAKQHGMWRGFSMLLLYLLALSIKDVIGGSISWYNDLAGLYTPGESILFALGDMFLNTILGTALPMMLLFSLFWVFSIKHSEKEIPITLFQIKKDPLALSAIVTVALTTLMDLLTQIQDIIAFGEENFWLITTGETITMAVDLIYTPVAGVLSLLGVWWMRHLLLQKTED